MRIAIALLLGLLPLSAGALDTSDKSSIKVIVPSNFGKVYGSGFLIHEAGFIVTAAHVVEALPHIKTQLKIKRHPHFSKVAYPASVVYIDYRRDVAIVKVDMTVSWTDTLPIYEQHLLPSGSKVHTVSSCDLYPDFFRHTGKVLFYRSTKFDKMSYLGLASTMPIQPGCSGGAVVGPHGGAVGVNSLLVLARIGSAYTLAAPLTKLRERIVNCSGPLEKFKDSLCKGVKLFKDETKV